MSIIPKIQFPFNNSPSMKLASSPSIPDTPHTIRAAVGTLFIFPLSHRCSLRLHAMCRSSCAVWDLGNISESLSPEFFQIRLLHFMYFWTNINLLIIIYIIFYSYFLFIQKSYKFTCSILKTNISLPNLTYFLLFNINWFHPHHNS